MKTALKKWKPHISDANCTQEMQTAHKKCKPHTRNANRTQEMQTAHKKCKPHTRNANRTQEMQTALKKCKTLKGIDEMPHTCPKDSLNFAIRMGRYLFQDQIWKEPYMLKKVCNRKLFTPGKLLPINKNFYEHLLFKFLELLLKVVRYL